jgi:signal transduction histidine kinase
MKEGKPYQYVSIRSDSTEKVANKQKIEDQKQFYEFILNNLPADIAVFSPDHKYLFINPVAIKNNELRNFMIGKDDFEYCEFKGIDSSLAIERRRAFNELIANKEFVEWEDEKILDNGERHITLRKMGPIYNNEGELVVVIGYGLEITSRKIAEENVVIAKKEVERINLNLQGLVQEETKKNIKLSQSLNESEKLSTIGELASGIAHDLNTPLGTIKNGGEAIRYTIDTILNELIWKFTPEQVSFAIKTSIENKSDGFIRGIQYIQLLKEFRTFLSENYKQLTEIQISEFASAFMKIRIDLNERDLIATILNNSNALELIKLIDNLQTTWKFIDSIVVSADRAANVVNDLRSLIKNQKSERSSVNLHENITTVLNVFGFELKTNVEIDFNVDKSTFIDGYDIRLFQLWSNIIKNAIEAMDNNVGEKLLKISSVETNDTIVVSIENNGVKIPDEALAKIFDKFYSSKLGTKKSGLGLSIVKNIISEHDAEIKVSSTEFSTIFTVSFNKKRNE